MISSLMIAIQMNLLFLVVFVAFASAVLLRIADSIYRGKNASVRFVLRVLFVGATVAACGFVFGSRVGSIAHCASQCGSGYGDLAGYAMATGPAPF